MFESCTRRAFLHNAVQGGVKAAALPLAFKVLLEAQTALGGTPFSRGKEVMSYTRLENGTIRCGVCPNLCRLKDGQTGICRARTNHQGIHYNQAYGNPCILKAAPIEKLPMNHFLPGSDTICIAVGGCNLRCLYCQNWEWSQREPEKIPQRFELGPGEAVHSVLKKDVRTIAFTYTDPIAFLEYALDIAQIARRSGVRCVAATNGFATKETARQAAKKLDAITVGLKGFDDGFYSSVCGARLGPVLDAIVEIQSQDTCWLELTTLIVPTYNDDKKKIKEMARWIRKNLGTRVPWHLSRFVPQYKLKNVPRTPVHTLDEAMEMGLDEGLEYVYTSNVAPHRGNNTYCPRCGRAVIERLGFKILKNELDRGRCRCGLKMAGILETHKNR
jgi:pyruvate formate lyase activating enzyme